MGKKSIDFKDRTNEKKELYILYGETVLKLKADKHTNPSDVTYAIPLNYEDQVPIFFDIKNDTSSKVINFQIVDDENPPNKLIKFSINSLEKNEKITIHFCYWVLVKNQKYKNIRKTIKIPKEYELPDFSKQWLVSTEAIQSDNFLIKIKAIFLRGFNNNLLSLAKKILFTICYHRPILSLVRDLLEKKPFLRDIFLPKRYWTGLMDAVSGLLFGGLCATKTNLEVALLRANGVPSRILIVNPIHYYSEKIDWVDALHYIVEFYVIDYGWVRAMSGRVPYQPKNDIVLRIVYPEDENEAGNGLSYYGGMEPWFWFSNKDISLDFPEDIFTLYKKPKSSGIPITTGATVCKIEIEEKTADTAYKLTQNNWEKYTYHFGKKLSHPSSKSYTNAVNFQKQALHDITISKNIRNYIENIKKSHASFKEITI